MRIHIKLLAFNKSIDFDHQPQLVGAIHKWLGLNNEHGEISLYSFSRLEGGKATKNGIQFENSCSFFFSSFKDELVKKMIAGIQKDPTLFNGLIVNEVHIEEEPDLSNRELFFVGSPIFIKRKNGNKIDHILYDDPKATEYLRETLQTKMKTAGIEDNSFDIKFDLTYPEASTKMITYKGIKNKVNWCNVIIKGKPETKQFAWNVGLGNSTGIGFGAIK